MVDIILPEAVHTMFHQKLLVEGSLELDTVDQMCTSASQDEKET